MTKNGKRRRLTAAEVAEADARAEHFQKCWRYFGRVHAAALRAKERDADSNSDRS